MDAIPNYHDLPLIYSDFVKSKAGQYKLCSFCDSKEGCSSIMAKIFVEKGKPKSKVLRDKIFELLWGCKYKEGQTLKYRYDKNTLYIGLCHFHDVQKKITGEECSVFSFIGEKEAQRSYGEKDMGAYKIDGHYFLSLPLRTMEDSRARTTPSSPKNYGLFRGIASIFMSIKKSKKRLRTPSTANTNGSDEPQRQRNKPTAVDQEYNSHHEEEKRKEPLCIVRCFF